MTDMYDVCVEEVETSLTSLTLKGSRDLGTELTSTSCWVPHSLRTYFHAKISPRSPPLWTSLSGLISSPPCHPFCYSVLQSILCCGWLSSPTPAAALKTPESLQVLGCGQSRFSQSGLTDNLCHGPHPLSKPIFRLAGKTPRACNQISCPLHKPQPLAFQLADLFSSSLFSDPLVSTGPFIFFSFPYIFGQTTLS